MLDLYIREFSEWTIKVPNDLNLINEPARRVYVVRKSAIGRRPSERSNNERIYCSDYVVTFYRKPTDGRVVNNGTCRIIENCCLSIARLAIFHANDGLAGFD